MSTYEKDYYQGISKFYFDRVLDKIIRLGNLKSEKGLILDFGCGFQHLKKKLKGKSVVGYDIIPELSDVKNYKNLRPSVIVCNAVFEHMDEEELRKTLNNFKNMNNNAKLVVALPTENIVSRIGMILTGYTWAHSDHKLKLRGINYILAEYCKRVKKEKVLTMNEVSLWVFK